MALGPLWLGLTLLGALQSQAQDPSLTAIPRRPSLNMVPLQPDFQDHQFQGEWYAIGWAQNTILTESLSKASKLSSTFELNDDHSYNVTSIWLGEQGCVKKMDTVIPSDLPGQYIVDDITRYKGFQNVTMDVVETDYKQYAVVLYRAAVENKVYVECLLYGRKAKLSREVIRYFFNLAKSLGFHQEYINFTKPVVGCNIDYLD